MPITSASLIRAAHFENVTQFSVTTPVVAAGGHIYLGVACDKPMTGRPTDTAGNNYDTVAGTSSSWGSILWWGAQNTLRLNNNSTIAVPIAPGAPWTTMSGTMGGISVRGFTSGAWEGSCSSFGEGTAVFGQFPALPPNDYVIGILAVEGPSSDGFTQDSNWQDPAGFNSIVSASFSIYAAFARNTTANPAQLIWQPTLGVSRRWMVEMAAIQS